MHLVEPYFHWRNLYVASEDEASPFHGRDYSEFEFGNRIYNFYIHPQWDHIGSPTLYIKILYVDYEFGFSIIEMIGEWNDTIENDIMTLKRDIIDQMINTQNDQDLLGLIGNNLPKYPDVLGLVLMGEAVYNS